MCGIAGLVAADRLDPLDLARLPRMRDVLAHRGPDDGRVVARRSRRARPSPPEHRRPRGRAPAARQRGRRHPDRLQRRDLQPRASCARSSRRTGTATGRAPTPRRSCTPTRSGATTCVHRFRGMFAFAHLGRAGAGACCSRATGSGIKPLYWARAGGTLLFASEIKALLASGLVRRRGRTKPALPELLATRAVSGDETLFARRPQAAPGAPAGVRGRPRHRSASTGTCRTTRLRRRRPRTSDREWVAAFRRSARGVGPPPPDGGRAARHVPVRRDRQFSAIAARHGAP